MDQIREALKELNLNEKQAEVYLSALFLGEATATEIAKKTNINRVTTYDILKSLINLGYMSQITKSNVKHYIGVDPEHFLKELEQKKDIITAIIPELKKIKSTINKHPLTEVYTDIKGIKYIFNDILKSNSETLFWGAPMMLQKLEIIFPQFIKKKRTQKMFSKVITTNQKDMQDYKKKSDNRFVEMKFIPDNINITKIIYSNKVAYLTFDEKNSYAILIKDQRIANNEKNAFDLVWNLL